MLIEDNVYSRRKFLGLRRRQTTRRIFLHCPQRPIHRRPSLSGRLLLRHPHDLDYSTFRTRQNHPPNPRPERTQTWRETQIQRRRGRCPPIDERRRYKVCVPRLRDDIGARWTWVCGLFRYVRDYKTIINAQRPGDREARPVVTFCSYGCGWDSRRSNVDSRLSC